MSKENPYRGPINRPCSACSAGDTAMRYHDHDYVDLSERRQGSCQYVSTEYILPGWGCCQCRIYNGAWRQYCKRCGHAVCIQLPDDEVLESRRMAAQAQGRAEPIESINVEACNCGK